MYALKRTESTQFDIGEYSFYVTPFPAMKSAGIAADVAKVIGPALGGFISLVGGNGTEEANADNLLAGIDSQKAVSVIGEALSSLNGDEMERIISRLLLDNNNVSVSGPYTDFKAVRMNREAFDEVFCCEAQNIFVLCWDVINLNYKSFFKNIALQFGNQTESTESLTTSAMESLT
ncbi:MAG: hypothetical protein E7576_07890 [Ruminococcaceae bacterium]|nr:hypothetical protein [Oscillospiraceae bacterium]